MMVRNTKELGQVIRAHRKAAKLSQGALAKAAGTTQPWVSEVENGKPTAEVGMILHLLEVLGVEVMIAVPGEGSPSA
jgi:HTH-type transcriptional regulator/antitoxin HipB